MKSDEKILKQSQFVALVLNSKLTDNIKCVAEWYNSQKDHSKTKNIDLFNRFKEWMPT